MLNLGKPKLAKLRQHLLFLVGDAILLGIVLYSTLLLHFEWRMPETISNDLPLLWIVALATMIPFLYRERLYSVAWSFVSLRELLAVVRAVTLGSVLFAALVIGLQQAGIFEAVPRSVIALVYTFNLLVIGGFRLLKRTHRFMSVKSTSDGEATIVVGAGVAGDKLLRSLTTTNDSGYKPIAIVDDDPVKLGTLVHGIPVLGPTNQLPRLIRQHGISRVIIAMPSAPPSVTSEVVDLARSAGISDVRILPSLTRLLNLQVSASDLRDIDLQDLLGRETLSIGTDEVEEVLQGTRVLVTGAGGSIGNELCRQIMHFNVHSLALLEQNETALFDIHKELQSNSTSNTKTIIPILADLRDKQRIRQVIKSFSPHIIFHAAAYKHVGMLEHNPKEAFLTNVVGTSILAQSALEAEVKRFVLISTDKAVDPTSVMGVSKRVAEQLCITLNKDNSTKFIVVRFGNVLGTRGSVVPIFREQIRRGGPVTVRGKDVRRYFMDISEAVLLVLEAGSLGEGGEIMVLDMGKPIKIVDLARELIRLCGVEPYQDIPIVFSELEPGEKKSESLLTSEESAGAIRLRNVHVVHNNFPISAETLLEKIDRMLTLTFENNQGKIIKAFQELVPSYTPSAIVTAEGENCPAHPSD